MESHRLLEDREGQRHERHSTSSEESGRNRASRTPFGTPCPILTSSSEDTEDDCNSMACDYEHAVESAGFGRFHYLHLFVCGWANAADAIEILCISFLLPTASCELGLTSADKGVISAVMFLGMLVGGYVWGSLGDMYGRRKTLIVAMVVNFACGLASAFAGSKNSFIVWRFLSGLGVGGSIPLVWTYFVEFQPRARRGAMVSALATFWMVGNITVAALAWIIIPTQKIENVRLADSFSSWRIFAIISAVPALLVAISMVWMPDSPKFLVNKRQNHRALKVLANVYKINTGRQTSSFPVSRIEDSVSWRPGAIHNQSVGVRQRVFEVLRNMRGLFSGSVRRPMLLMIYINFAIQFGYYGLWLWFPELFNKLDQYYAKHNETKTVCQISEFQTGGDDPVDPCSVPLPGNQVYIDSFLVSISALPGNIWCICHMDKFGRKFFLVLSMTLSGACAFLIYLVSSSTANLLVSMGFGLVSTMGFNALDALGVELFPTHLRSTAMAVTLVPARLGAILGNIVFGFALDVNCAIPILSVASLLISGGLVGLLLPNTTRRALE